MKKTMGRRPTKNLNLPPKMRARAKAGGKIWYYYDAGGKPRREIPLGCDYTTAVLKWTELVQDKPECAGQLITFKAVSDRYLLEVLPYKAPQTQRGNLRELDWLLKFFNDPPAPLARIKPIHIRKYLDWRGKTAKVRANREKALFSHIWNMAREWGLTDRSNPCSGIKGFTEAGRDIYVEDEVLNAVWEVADVALRDALDLAYLTGQRPADTRKMRITDIKDDVLIFQQGKTGKKMRIDVSGELASLIKRIEKRKEGYKIHTLSLVCTETGRALTECAMRSRFDKARGKASKANPELAEAIQAFQFRDLRAKAATDKSDSDGMREAQLQLGHETIAMTEHYVRKRKGHKVSPTK
ncbi:MAG: tyrosine-type recombinase/integrase [Gallionellaceae bacterium]